ncbi:serine hydrolase domain-containing protein [Pseudomaricurvus sp.]|uniref:serine hydrolase domain-containing protein n=1 Tax=Pseudomaricurvus sp. TaxID=2004510 RepID=UPI003F6AB80D
MRKILLTLTTIAITLVVVASFAGITPTYLVNAPAMLTGMGAKLGCSGHYVTGLSQQQSFKDLQSYSPVLKLVDLEFDDATRRVNADLWGLGSATAQYRPGLGCTLSIGSTEALNQLAGTLSDTEEKRFNPEVWPKGDAVPAVRPELQSQLDELLSQDNQQGLQTRALLVVQDGQLLAESYAPGFDQHSRLLGWSMAKSVTSLMMGHLEMTGELDFDQQPVFEEWADDERRNIHWRDLMHMSSGLNFPEVYEPGAGATDMLFTVHRGSDLPLEAELIHPPGDVFEYSSGTTNLMSRKLFEATGGKAESNLKYLQKNLVEPLGLRDFVFEPDPSGIFVGSSYLYASARDWARIGQLMLNRGELNGYRLVSEEWVHRALQPNQSDNTRSYGYQFWLNRGDDSPRWKDLPADSFAALGNRKQVVMVIPSKNAVIVRLGWTSERYPTSKNMSEILSWMDSDRLSVRN